MPMQDLSGSFRLDRMRSGNAAVYLLKEQFENFLSSPQRADMCDWIAKCFYQLEQFGDAGNWYETAGQLIMGEPSTPPTLKAMAAVAEYEKALDCYEHGDDDESISRCADLVRKLARACASA